MILTVTGPCLAYKEIKHIMFHENNSACTGLTHCGLVMPYGIEDPGHQAPLQVMDCY